MIAGIVVAGLFVNILIFIFLCRFLYRRKKKPDGKKIDPGIPRLTRALSVKDHINNLYADDPLRSKIFVDDLTEIKQYPVDKVAYEKDLGEGQFGQVFQGRKCRQMKERVSGRMNE